MAFILTKITARLYLKYFVNWVRQMKNFGAQEPKKRGRPTKPKKNELEVLRRQEILLAREEYNRIVNKNIFKRNIGLGQISI